MTYFKEFLEKRKAEIRESLGHEDHPISIDDRTWARARQEEHDTWESIHDDQMRHHQKLATKTLGTDQSDIHHAHQARHEFAGNKHAEASHIFNKLWRNKNATNKDKNHAIKKNKEAFEHTRECYAKSPNNT